MAATRDRDPDEREAEVADASLDQGGEETKSQGKEDRWKTVDQATADGISDDVDVVGGKHPLDRQEDGQADRRRGDRRTEDRLGRRRFFLSNSGSR
jgi:hypothetical protein